MRWSCRSRRTQSCEAQPRPPPPLPPPQSLLAPGAQATALLPSLLQPAAPASRGAARQTGASSCGCSAHLVPVRSLHFQPTLHKPHTLGHETVRTQESHTGAMPGSSCLNSAAHRSPAGGGGGGRRTTSGGRRQGRQSGERHRGDSSGGRGFVLSSLFGCFSSPKTKR